MARFVVTRLGTNAKFWWEKVHLNGDADETATHTAVFEALAGQFTKAPSKNDVRDALWGIQKKDPDALLYAFLEALQGGNITDRRAGLYPLQEVSVLPEGHAGPPETRPPIRSTLSSGS